MVNDPNRSIQVLNISNVNAQGKTVLNDGKLLELIQKYPFLYNQRVRGYNEADYTLWAWKNINAAFNRSYANDPSAAFSTDDLMKRWHVLKTLIQCLSKAYDLNAIPQTLKQSVVKISTELEYKSNSTVTKPNTYAQNILLQHICDIGELPLDKKLDLEKEILELILNTELESKQSTTLDKAAWKEIDQNTEEFLNEIGFKQLMSTAVNHEEKKSYFNNSRQRFVTRLMKTKKSLGWVQRKDAHKVIKPCEIRLHRINVEDYLPLAKIINFKRSFKSEDISNPASPGIFGI